MWLLPGSTNNSKHENATIDVVNKGCFYSYDAVACTRTSFLGVIVAVTAFFCITRVVKLHIQRHHQLHQLLIFYVAAIECILSAIYWTSGGHYPQVDFSLSYLKLWQYVVICHFYWNLATRILHKEPLVKQIINPILAIYVLYFMVIAIMGMTEPKSSWMECFEPEWLFLSVVELFTVQLFMVAGIYITKKLNQISSDEAFKNSQKRDLWSVIIVYETSAIVCVIYDLTLKSLEDEEGGCSGIFYHDQILYSLVFALFMTIKFVIPIWVILYVFHPNPLHAVDHDSIFGWSFDGNVSTSVFKPTGHGSSSCRHMRFPTTSNYGAQGSINRDSINNQGRNNQQEASIAEGTSPTQGCPTCVTRLQPPLAPITEEDGISGMSTSLSSDKSSVLDSGLRDNQPLLKKEYDSFNFNAVDCVSQTWLCQSG